jgi:hypothetical protein
MAMIVELRSVPGCPNLPATREVLRRCLRDVGLPEAYAELVGAYRSPSVLVDGIDVTGADPRAPAACVLRPPTAEEIGRALRQALRAGPAGAPGPGRGTDE